MYQGRLAGRRLQPGGREQQRTVAVSNPRNLSIGFVTFIPIFFAKKKKKQDI
jgi:hypothetical protein